MWHHYASHVHCFTIIEVGYRRSNAHPGGHVWEISRQNIKAIPCCSFSTLVLLFMKLATFVFNITPLGHGVWQVRIKPLPLGSIQVRNQWLLRLTRGALGAKFGCAPLLSPITQRRHVAVRMTRVGYPSRACKIEQLYASAHCNISLFKWW